MEVSVVQDVKLKNKNMKKQILNLGKTLNKIEQKLINGGKEIPGGCRTDKGYYWHPLERCCWTDQYNCCYGTPECPAPYL
ncbi:hypothetical protein MK851_07325 [Tenacibaculum sp. 1B UA]|uniref:hypothetical protein n=1 Tax=unclassified Tenacibaculum TaxID=2635139 RepID=UPI0026E319CB|nr:MULTISPECIES: hypothetical protein [unclassified Tenacibaculum]MDO6675827.1 hypothetical protein [Tenacibaculum sp. 1_MG-2023]MDX8553439.1 hypothetical protein [Tenacibaculum sp. 1B UA]